MGVVKQKVDRRGQGEGEGLQTSNNVRTSFMDDTLISFQESKVSKSAYLCI